MAFGIGRLRLGPAEFWALTPRELACLAGPAADPFPGSAALAELEARLGFADEDDAR